jgi:hypothetical protein
MFRSPLSLARPVLLATGNQASNKIPPKTSFSILDGAISRTLQRGLVTKATYGEVEKNIPGVDFRTTMPYQEPEGCENQADKIIDALRKARPEEATEVLEPEKGFWNQLKIAMTGDPSFERIRFSKADDLLHTFNKHGFFTLRGPGLATGMGMDDPYIDGHSVAVFSVNQINVPGKGTKIVIGMMDCNDCADDPETNASKATVKETKKQYLSELTHEEANQNGAHLRRIRFVDADALSKHTNELYWHFKTCGDKIVSPEITFLKKDSLSLTPQEVDDLSKVLVGIYDKEVEKFEGCDYSWFAHNKEANKAQGQQGSSMAQQLRDQFIKK